VLIVATDDRHEVAVTAAVDAEREMDVHVPRAAHEASTRFGRATSSPPQFGHTCDISSAHERQKVHS
jgi:hypothetical protein